MSRINKIDFRYASYYLDLYLELASRPSLEENDWQKYEADLENLRHAWGWLKDNKDEPFARDLFLRYAELGWVLLDYNYKHLVRIVAAAVTSNSSANKPDGSSDEIIQKLNRLLSSNEKILSVLPAQGLFGNRNVNIGGDVSNAAVYTGDNIFLGAPDYHRALKFAYENNDLERAGKLLFEKSEILYKLGCLPEAIANTEEALKVCSEIEDEEFEKVQTRLSEWQKELDY